MKFWRQKAKQAAPPPPPKLINYLNFAFPDDYRVKQDDLVSDQFTLVQRGWGDIGYLTIIRDVDGVKTIKGRFWGQTAERQRAIIYRFAKGLSLFEIDNGRPPLDFENGAYSVNLPAEGSRAY